MKYHPFRRKEFVKHQLFKTCRYASGDLTVELSEKMEPESVLNLRRDFSMPLLHDFLRLYQACKCRISITRRGNVKIPPEIQDDQSHFYGE